MEIKTVLFKWIILFPMTITKLKTQISGPAVATWKDRVWKVEQGEILTKRSLSYFSWMYLDNFAPLHFLMYDCLEILSFSFFIVRVLQDSTSLLSSSRSPHFLGWKSPWSRPYQLWSFLCKTCRWGEQAPALFSLHLVRARWYQSNLQPTTEHTL